MHSKHQGSIGEMKVAYELLSLGHPVFYELGDLSKVDLITLVNEKPIKIQVKCYHTVDGVVRFSTRKSGPNYQFTYKESDVDLFAVYIIDKDITLYFGWDKLRGQGRMNFRTEPTKNNQARGINLCEDFTDFSEALSDYIEYTSK